MKVRSQILKTLFLTTDLFRQILEKSLSWHRVGDLREGGNAGTVVSIFVSSEHLLGPLETSIVFLHTGDCRLVPLPHNSSMEAIVSCHRLHSSCLAL